MKIKAWGIEQAVWGLDRHSHVWFANKEARDKYYAEHNYCAKLRCRMMDTDDVNVYQTYGEYLTSISFPLSDEEAALQ